MTNEAFDRATKIKDKIAKLQWEIRKIPIQNIDETDKSWFNKYDYRIRPNGVNLFELTNDDFSALREVRVKKIKELEEELRKL